MIAPKKLQLLERFLGTLPLPMAARLAKAIEVDRLAGSTALPHSELLDLLRPLLRQGDAVRIQTPRRLFCKPFQDLFVNGPRREKQKGVIGRESILPVWNWLESSLLPEACAAFVRDCRKALLTFNEPEALARTAEFWHAAAAAMSTALMDGPSRARARAALGGDLVVADAEEMALLLSAGEEIDELQRLLPRPVAALSEPLLFDLREVYERLIARSPDAAPYVAVIVMRRLPRPWEALRLPLFVSRQHRDTLISATDMGLVGDVLFHELDGYLAFLRSVRPPEFDAAAVSQAVAGFAELSMGLVKEVEMRRDGRWGQRLITARAAAAEAVEALLERAAREILGCFPMQRASYAGGGRAPDLARPLDADKKARARRYTDLVTGCRHFAAAVSVGALLKSVEEEVGRELRSYTEGLLRELREISPEQRARGEEALELTAEITAKMVSAEEAEFLMRRGRAALASIAA